MSLPINLTTVKMKQMSRVQNAVFLTGGALMVIGAGCFAFGFTYQPLLKVVCWVFLVGALMFSIPQAMLSYEGAGLTLRRLKRIQCAADLFFVLAGISMADTAYLFFRPLFDHYETYLTYVYNKWVVLLLIAAVLEMYTTHRIGSELRKEDRKGNENGGSDSF